MVRIVEDFGNLAHGASNFQQFFDALSIRIKFAFLNGSLWLAERDSALEYEPTGKPCSRGFPVGTPGSLVVQDCQIELAQARGIGDRLDLSDLAVPDGETQDEEQVPTRRHDERHGSVHESRSEALSTS